MKRKTSLYRIAQSLLLGVAAVAAQGVTFDFRPTSEGGNVGEFLDNQPIGQATVDGILMDAAVLLPSLFGGALNYNSGSAALGMGVRSNLSGDRPTQIDVGEGIGLHFNSPVQVLTLTLQVFFLSADNGAGGPVSMENDAVDIFLGGETRNVVSPVEFSTGDPTTFTIDLTSLGFTTTFLDPDDENGYVMVAPSAGDGVRLRSITVVPEPKEWLALFSLGLLAFGCARASFKRRSAV